MPTIDYLTEQERGALGDYEHDAISEYEYRMQGVADCFHEWMAFDTEGPSTHFGEIKVYVGMLAKWKSDLADLSEYLHQIATGDVSGPVETYLTLRVAEYNSALHAFYRAVTRHLTGEYVHTRTDIGARYLDGMFWVPAF